MANLLLFFCVSLAASLVFTPLVRFLAFRRGLVDRPDKHRKMHTRVTPVAGGVALLLSGLVAFGVVSLLVPALSDQVAEKATGLLGLLMGAVTICAIGVADDFGLLRGRHKLLGQVLAALVVVQFTGAVETVRLFGWHVELGPLAIPCTVGWLLAAINSLNLLDGLDGLLSCVALIISLAIAAMAVVQMNWTQAYVAAALVGAILGFMRYNLPPASIFLGDSGSMLIGLVLGSLAIQSSLKGPATVALATPTALLALPFFDTFAAIIRRKLTGRSIYTTDRGHLHHCLLRRGFSNHGVLLVVSLACCVTVGGALASLALEQELFALCSAAVMITLLILTRLFGYAEFVLVGKRLSSLATSFLRGPAKDKNRSTEVRLQGSADWTALWAELISQVHELDLRMVRLNVNAPALHEGYHARWDASHQETEEISLWRADMPLTVQGQHVGRLEVIGARNDEPLWIKITRVMSLVERFESAAKSLLATACQSANGSSEPDDKCNGTPMELYFHRALVETAAPDQLPQSGPHSTKGTCHASESPTV